jgi:formylglycine-generating enzyme required for sulfatase activity
VGVFLAAGQRPLPEYELVHRLGRGGFGEVWKATGPGGFGVALKFIRLGDQAGRVETRSLELMRDIRHAHLLALFGAWQRDDYLIVAMELGDRTLLDLLRQAQGQGLPGIPGDKLLEYMREAAKGIDYLNEPHHPSGSGALVGIQHKDIKPQNLLLVGGTVKVADYGLAKMLEHTATSTSGGVTPAYAAPELLGGRVTRWSDQYGLAVSYCQLRGGRLPFEGTAMQIMAGHATEPPDLTMLPEAERPVVARALAKQPDERWPNCREFAEALAGSVRAGAEPEHQTTAVPPPLWREHRQDAARGSAPHPPLAATTVPVPSRSRRSRKRGLVGVAVLLTLSVSAVLLWSSRAWKGPSADGLESGTTEAGSTSTVQPVPMAAELTNSIGMRLVLIPAGRFRMGSPSGEGDRRDDEEQHEVEITRPFYLDRHEVTQAAYEKVMGHNPSYFAPGGAGEAEVRGLDTGSFPVDSVTWEDAREFCQRLSDLPAERGAGRVYRLPTEAEWEYACRGGARESVPFHTGPSLPADQANFDRKVGRTRPVGSFQKANGYGLFDMHGNVSEWCADRYAHGYYPVSPVRDPAGPDRGARRVLRGGSWERPAGDCRSAARRGFDPGVRNTGFGFRVVCVPPARKP